MTIAIAQPARTGNPGIVPPWLQGPRPVTPPLAPGAPTTPAPQPEIPTAVTRDALGHEAPSSLRGFGAVEGARDGVNVQAEQRRIDDTVMRVQSAYAKLGITAAEGNGPVKAYFRPSFPNAAYAPDGYSEYDLPRDSIGVGIDRRSGRSFGEAEDVVAHEVAHRIIDKTVPQKLSMSPLSEDVAVHESLADTFASLVDRDDWVLGEQLVKPVRIMDKPEQVGDPGNVSDLKEFLGPRGPGMVSVGRDRRTGEVVKAPNWHRVAGIPNKAASIIGDGLGRDKLGEIYIKAVRENVRGGKQIEGLAGAVLQSAKDLYGADSREFQVTKDAWDAVGVLELLEQQ